MKYRWWFALGLLVACGSATAAEQPYLQIHAQADRSAIWVGDRFHYRVSVLHDAQVRFVTDNLQKGSLNLAPFEALALEHHERPAAAGRRILEIDLLLTTYEAEAKQMEIPSFSLFYFAESAAMATSSDRPAETLPVPPFPIALRSTLPEDVSSPRDVALPPATPLRHRLARPLAIGFLVLALILISPLFFQGKRLWAAQEIARQRKQAQESFRGSLRELAGRVLHSEREIQEFYEDVNHSLRGYLSAISGDATEGKTPRELASQLSATSDSMDGFPLESLRDIPVVLEICERVRYSPNGVLLGTQQHGTVVERLRAMAGTGKPS